MIHFGPISFLALMAVGSGPVLFLRGLRELRLRRLIENTPTARIRSLAMGLVEINGIARPRSAFTGPFSCKPCVYWEVDISVPGNQKGTWRIFHRGASGHPFHVDDGTGIAMVYPNGAECHLPDGYSEQCLGAGLPPPYWRYMDQHGLTSRPFWRIETMRFRERSIEEGQRVYVLGSAEPRAQGLDISHDTPEALGPAGTEATAPAGPDAADSRHLPAPDPPVAVIRRGSNDTTYIISLQSERAITATLELEQIVHLAFGPLITVLGVGYWLFALAPGAVAR